MTSRSGVCSPSGVARFLVAATLVKVALSTTTPAVFAKTAEDAHKLMTQLSDSRVIGGTVAVQKGGQLVWSGGYGYASEELNVPLQDYHIFPIGSNTKFFTAVAIYQLQDRGLLNVSDAVNGYIVPEDFGLDGPWCPKIHGQEKLGCQEPTFKQLMRMTSGLLPTDNGGCGTPNSTWTPSDWFWDLSITNLNLTYGEAVGADGNWLNGNATLRDLLRFQQTFKQPMLYPPGTQYCYVNAGFNIAGYVIERLTNMSLSSYFDEFILKPANLSNTYYWVGAQGLEPTGARKNVVTIPGYTTSFKSQPGSDAPAFQLFNRVTWFPGDLSAFAAAAGAMFSDVFDLLKWYNTFTSKPEVIGLSKQSLAALLEPLTHMPIDIANASFAQGIVVEPLSSQVKKVEYTGGIWGYYTHIEYWANLADPSKSDAVLFFSNVSPIAPAGANGTCAVLSAQNGAPIKLKDSACNPQGADMTSWVTTQLAQIWNITGTYSSS